MIRYLLRLDDASPTMNRTKWHKIETILEQYHIKPMIGIIPNNEDINLNYASYDSDFTKKMLAWKKKGWTLALHGYNHQYESNDSGINPIHKRSEFAGLELEKQKQKIKSGIQYFHNNNIKVDYFFAPAHTFDLNTIEALKSESNIRIISDTIAFNPYKRYGMTFIPQQFGYFRKINIPGTWTFCYHPSTMNEKSIDSFKYFIAQYRRKFISFQDLNLIKVKNNTLFDQLYRITYFLFRKLNK
jgi:predicted deacetylase